MHPKNRPYREGEGHDIYDVMLGDHVSTITSEATFVSALMHDLLAGLDFGLSSLSP